MILKGKKYEDNRGIITYNNEFDASKIKRIYTIENHNTEYTRGWQGHKVEQRWFAAIKGKFEINVIEIDDFQNPAKNLSRKKFILTDQELTYLHIPAKCVTAIRAIEKESKLLVLADYKLGEIQDEYRYPLEYFDI